MIEHLATHQPELAAMAAAWLSAGAESFGIWHQGAPLQLWPAGRSPARPALAEPILAGGKAVAELRLTGAGGAARAQLASEARLIARLLEAEDDLEQMTGELLATQDTLVALYELTQVMRRHRDMSDLLELLVSEATRLLKIEGAALLLPPALAEHPAGIVEQLGLRAAIAEALTRGAELTFEAPDAALGSAHNLCVVPLRVRGDTAAVFALINRPGGFSAPDLKLARAIAEQAGAQIERAQLVHETMAQVRLSAEMEVARKVQAHLLPQSRPQLPCLDIFADSRPALQVGGDFYDFVVEAGRLPMFILGDVAGKGVSAALIMSMIRSSARSAARFMPKASPASVLSRANQDLYDDLTMLEAFVTTFVAQYDPRAQQIHYANAGHSPVVYRPAGGPACILESDGVPVGVLPVDMCQNHTLSFPAGAMLIIATDGFNETCSPDGEMFGYERLLAFADEFADQPAHVIARSLYDAVEAFSHGSPQDDDRTLIVIKGVEICA